MSIVNERGEVVDWRDTQIPARFFIFDVLALVPLLALLPRWSMWTFSIAIGFMVISVALDYVGYRPVVALRKLRTIVLGRYRRVPRGRRFCRR